MSQEIMALAGNIECKCGHPKWIHARPDHAGKCFAYNMIGYCECDEYREEAMDIKKVEESAGAVRIYEENGIIVVKMGAFVHAHFTPDQAAILLDSLQKAIAKLPATGPMQ